MRLSGSQYQQIQQALLNAFDEAGLQQLVRFELDADLDQIAGGKDLTERVHNLVAWSDLQDRILPLVEGALRQNPTNVDLQALAPAIKLWLVPQNDGGTPPYKGLAFYDVADSGAFFGRGQLTQELVEFLRRERFLAVIGASGSGKSSVIRAGLVACIGQGGLPGSERWLVRIVTPGVRPLESLALALMLPGESEDETARFVRSLREEPQALHLRARRLLEPRRQPRLLLVIDQFEELFTQCQDARERKAVMDNLLAATDDAGVTSVVIALRADLYHRCAEYEELRRLLESNQRYIGAMNHDELRAAIVQPAEVGGWSFEPGLVERILEDAAAEPGALPLFSFALLRTWEARNGTTLTFAGYLGAGGVQKALAQAADELYTSLDDLQQAAVKRIMLQVVQVDDNGQQARRRVPLVELTGGGGNRGVEQVLARLQSARLITTVTAPDGAGAPVIYVDVTHEALIREWGTLRQWLSENRAALLLRDRVDDAMRQWTSDGEDGSALLRGRFLSSALDWQQNNPDLVTPEQARFLALAEAERKRERNTKTRRTVLLTALASAVLFLLIPGLYFAAQTGMYYLRQGSAWQPTDFAFNSVMTMAVAPETRYPGAPILCVGTSDIGVGCTSDLKAWNVYQSGLPQRRPEFSNTRNTLLGSLWGSTWATKVVGVRALAFDQADPRRLYAATLDSDRIFRSEDAGVHWEAIDASLPISAPVMQLAAHGDNLFVLTAAGSGGNSAAREALYWSADGGKSWDVTGGATTPIAGMRDFVLLTQPNGDLWGVAAAGDTGLVWLPHDTAGGWLTAARGVGELAGARGLLIGGAGAHVYAAAYEHEQKRGALYRWAPGESAPPQRVGEFTERPLALAVESGEGGDERVWLLFVDGSVTSVSNSGQAVEHGSRPGWPLASAKVVRVLPGAEGVPFVLMAHSDGLLQLCDEEHSAACGHD